VKLIRPELIVIGPAYKLHLTANDDKDETIARTITTVLDDIRGDAALVLEHHAGNEQQGGARPVRPFGSSLWRRWPEFGYGIRRATVPKRFTAAEREKNRFVDLIAWRGARDERAWPRQLGSGGRDMPWVETVVPD
jgi:replicative DNA helicase